MNAARKTKSTGFVLNKWYPYGLVILIGYCIADLTIISYRDLMLPQGAPPARPQASAVNSTPALSQYSNIAGRNIFSSDGKIPEAITAKGQEGQMREAPPVPSQLPLNLVGTMVFSNSAKSLAAIEVKGKNLVMSLSIGKEIEGMAKIESVERHRVVFRNLNSGRLEYIEMKSDSKVSFGAAKTAGGAIGGREVVRTGQNQFAIKRSDLLKYTNDLPSILMQARAVPYRIPGSSEIAGYRVLDIQPGSVFEQLGIQRMDIIKGVNGTPVDSPAKAMELFNALKNGSNVGLMIERNGKTETFKYDITN